MTTKKRGQAAVEYLTTYGWALMSALVAIGALSYFGFLSPSKLLPNRCDLGTQLECVEYRILDDGSVDLKLRNNFGKDINITGFGGGGNNNPLISGSPLPLIIGLGQTEELNMTLNTPYLAGDKKQVDVIITFRRAYGDYPYHNVSGTVFVTVLR